MKKKNLQSSWITYRLTIQIPPEPKGILYSEKESALGKEKE